jgi:hypothetical protein
MRQGSARVYSHKTPLLRVPLIFASRIFRLVERPLLALRFSMRPAFVILTSQGGGITLQMMALARQRGCLSLIAVSGTTCLNGFVRRKREFQFFLSTFFFL